MTKLTGASYVKIALIIVFGALILGAIGFGGCSSWRLSSAFGERRAFSNSASVDAADVKNLSIKWGAGEVKVGVTDGGDAIELIETSTGGATKAQQMRWSVSGDTLNVDYGQWFSCSALMGRKSLEVRIPKSYAQQLGTVDIDGASGDYDVSGLGCESLKLQLASGDLTGLDLRADELRVDVASGHLNVEGRFPDRVNVRTASGETRVVCEEVRPHHRRGHRQRRGGGGSASRQRVHRAHRQGVRRLHQRVLVLAERQRVHERRRQRQRERAHRQRRVPHRLEQLTEAEGRAG